MSLSPQLSVILSTHNNAQHLGECLDSVLCQSLKEIEVIAVDVDSTDGTRKILAEAAEEDERVTFLTDNMGSRGRAKNIGMEHTRAPYVVFIEPEDRMDSQMLEQLYRQMEKSPDTDLLTCETDAFGEDS